MQSILKCLDNLAEGCLHVAAILLPFALFVGILCGLRTLFAPPQHLDGRRCLSEAVELVRDQPPQKRTLGLVFWTKDKIVLEEVWTREDADAEPE